MTSNYTRILPDGSFVLAAGYATMTGAYPGGMARPILATHQQPFRALFTFCRVVLPDLAFHAFRVLRFGTA
ncbi:MAG: hypothetical protein V4695_12220 [Pseudomonadota bacterium]